MIDSWQQKQILKLYIYFVVKTTSSVELFEVTHRNFKMAEMTSLHMYLKEKKRKKVKKKEFWLWYQYWNRTFPLFYLIFESTAGLHWKDFDSACEMSQHAILISRYPVLVFLHLLHVSNKISISSLIKAGLADHD